MTKLQDCVGKRVLVAVEGSPPQMTCVQGFSPRGQYVWLAPSAVGFDMDLGWRHVSGVQVLEVLGLSTESTAALQTKLHAGST